MENGVDDVGSKRCLRVVEGASLLGICVPDHEKVDCTEKCATVRDGLGWEGKTVGHSPDTHPISR